MECVSKGGNLLLNVGPDARGRIPRESLETLSQIGDWMRDNSASIYGCGAANLPKPENGRITQGNGRLYYHILENSIGAVPLYGVRPEQVESLRLLQDGSEIHPADNWMVQNYPDVVFAPVTDTPYLPNEIDTVVEITLKQ